jgi:8-oxo-dGTP diphosphatase
MHPPAAVELAAGAICWRAGDDGLEVLMVHSARWGDWSWPKGKLDPGETLPECAVREVAEETGVRVELGVPLPGSAYLLADGRDKRVSYWAGRVGDLGAATAAATEIDAVAWLPVPVALARLTRPGDDAPVRALLDLAARGLLDTRPLLVVRHAKARGRNSWPGAEADRPLTATGWRQAEALARLLTCWAPARLLSSPWARCRQTLEPYVARPHRPQPPVEVVPQLSEQGLHDDPDRIPALVGDLLGAGGGALLCTHRPVLAPIVAKLREAAVPNPVDPDPEARFPTGDPWLRPAGVLVAHVRGGKILSAEEHLGESPRKRRRQRR